MKNVSYSFIKNDQEQQGSFVLRSIVNSFGLETVNDKDVTSFYYNYSQEQYLDTGLLPLDGSGLLSIRKAFNHTQIAYQLKPGTYYINWGAHEGDHNAVKYYVAQPYRIIVADLVDNNLLGARTFYTTTPVTHPDVQLYHVNLPNINCKGYRGNGVGWICLYHTHDISKLTFNEKLIHIIERCSGVEAYNDANMKETDGPRFYAEKYNNDESYSYLWDPKKWETYTQEHGYEWTLNEDLWIPITVEGIDSQDKHVDNGSPLTFADALLGKYQAYYTDPLPEKPVNSIARGETSVVSDNVYKSFIRSYNSSSSFSTSVNTFSISQQHKESISDGDNLKLTTTQSFDEDDDTFVCADCENTHHVDDSNHVSHNKWVCENCIVDYVFLEETEQYYSLSDPKIIHDVSSDEYFHLDHIPATYWEPLFSISTCTCCGSYHLYRNYLDNSDYQNVSIWTAKNENGSTHEFCSSCIHLLTQDQNFALENVNELVNSCYTCGKSPVPVQEYININGEKCSINSHVIYLPENNYSPVPVCNKCYTANSNTTYTVPVVHQQTLLARCFCGELVPNYELHTLKNMELTFKSSPEEEPMSRIVYPNLFFALNNHSLMFYKDNLTDLLSDLSIANISELNTIISEKLASNPHIVTNPGVYTSPAFNPYYQQYIQAFASNDYSSLAQNYADKIGYSVDLLYACKSCKDNIASKVEETIVQDQNNIMMYSAIASVFQKDLMPAYIKNIVNSSSSNDLISATYISNISIPNIIHNKKL